MTPNFELFAHQTPDLLCTASLEGQFTWLNDRLSEVLGVPKEDLLDKPFLSFVHPDDLPATLDELSALAEGKKVFEFTNRYRTGDGGWVWLQWNSRVEDGVIYAIARDVTDREEAQAANQRRIVLLEQAERLMGLGHWFVDLVNDSVTWSTEVFRIHGLDPAHHTPTLAHGIDAYHPDDCQMVGDVVARAIEDQEPFEFEARIVRPGGEIRWVHSIGEPQIDPLTRATTGIFGAFRDITDDSRCRRARELEQFAHVASHDLKEPARTVRAYMELLGEEVVPTLASPMDTWWTYVRDAAERMEELIDSLHDYAQAGHAVTLEPVALGPLVQGITQDLSQLITDADGTVIVVRELPTVFGDGPRLRQVFQNLIANALKFRGDSPPEIEISAQADGEDWVIRCADNGRGFSPADAARVFEPFHRLGRDVAGTGMGLAVVQRVVTECGGTTWATGELGKGAVFHVRLRGALAEATTAAA